MKESIDFIKNYVTEDNYVVCATSGGVDSMTLLYLLTIIRKSLNINIICAHINHNLREESKEEFEFVKGYCAKNNIIFEGKIFEKNINFLMRLLINIMQSIYLQLIMVMI